MDVKWGCPMAVPRRGRGMFVRVGTGRANEKESS